MKVLFLSNSDWNLYLFRLPLARCLRRWGYDIVMAAPDGPYAARIESEGFRFVRTTMSRSGANPAAELTSVVRLVRMFRRERPDLLHTFTTKGVLYGGLAARLARLPVVVHSITGLGYLFSEERLRLLRPLIRRWYGFVLRGAETIFQNSDDESYFRRHELAHRTHLIVSSGVDTTRFTVTPEPAGPPVVMYVGRMVWMKGVGDFVEAARLLRSRGVEARFVLVGDADEGSPSSIRREQLQNWDDEGVIEWWGHRDDVAHVLAQCHVFCVPTAGREGVPRSLLEAGAAGRCLVATDTPGCREVVQPEENGLLTIPGDPSMLARSLERLVSNPDLRRKMGENARATVVEKFSIERVADATRHVYEGIGCYGSTAPEKRPSPVAMS